MAPVRADEEITGELVFLSLMPRPRERKSPESAMHAQVLMNASTALAAELADDELPRDLRLQLATQVGELIATAWTPHLPSADTDMPSGLRRLVAMARNAEEAQRRDGEAGLRRVIEVVGAHAKRNAYGIHRGFDPNANAVRWLARLDHPFAIAALFSVSRDGATEEIRRGAAIQLGELAARTSRERFTEACARILLE